MKKFNLEKAVDDEYKCLIYDTVTPGEKACNATLLIANIRQTFGGENAVVVVNWLNKDEVLLFEASVNGDYIRGRYVLRNLPETYKVWLICFTVLTSPSLLQYTIVHTDYKYQEWLLRKDVDIIYSHIVEGSKGSIEP